MTQVFINQIKDLLDKRNTVGTIELLKENHQMIENSLSDIASAIVSNLTSTALQHDKKAYKCSLEVLMFIVENCSPITFISQFPTCVQQASDHINFCAILDALESSIMKVEEQMKNKQGFFDFCFYSIMIYIEKLPLDEADDDQGVDRIIETYKTIVAFLELLVREATHLNYMKGKETELAKDLLKFLISLCGKPFCCLNKYLNEETKCIMEYENIVDYIMTSALCLAKDALCFLDAVSEREKRSTQRRVYSEIQMTDSINISNMAYANFYFYVITKENYWKDAPQVYNSYYILEMCAYLFKILLSEDYSISKGLIFMENVIKRIPLHSVDSEMLGLDIYMEIFRSITKVMIYSDNDEQRKKAVRIFQAYIEIFNMEARYTIILYLYEIVQHSGLLSFITGIFKSSIIRCLDSTPRNPLFLGKNMELLLKKVCNLPHRSSSDIVEISDEIITALNLLRFLFIRDKNNETGIWNMTDMLKNDYLNPLREGIYLCRAHWRVKTKDLEQQEKDLADEQDYSKLMKANMEVTLTVGGEPLPIMSLSEKISVCYQVLNGLDVMESILTRVNECIDMNEKFVKKSDECTELI